MYSGLQKRRCCLSNICRTWSTTTHVATEKNSKTFNKELMLRLNLFTLENNRLIRYHVLYKLCFTSESAQNSIPIQLQHVISINVKSSKYVFNIPSFLPILFLSIVPILVIFESNY